MVCQEKSQLYYIASRKIGTPKGGQNTPRQNSYATYARPKRRKSYATYAQAAKRRKRSQLSLNTLLKAAYFRQRSYSLPSQGLSFKIKFQNKKMCELATFVFPFKCKKGNNPTQLARWPDENVFINFIALLTCNTQLTQFNETNTCRDKHFVGLILVNSSSRSHRRSTAAERQVGPHGDGYYYYIINY